MPTQRNQEQKVRRGMRALSHDWEPMHEHCPGCGMRAPNHHERKCAVCGSSMVQDRLVWNLSPERVATRCEGCDGQGVRKLNAIEAIGTSCADRIIACERCRGSGWLGVDPTLPTDLRAGSEVKVIVLAVRYAFGLPLWHHADHREVVPLNVIVVPETAGAGDPRRARQAAADDLIGKFSFEDEFADSEEEEALICA